jgi:hypothetical protein
MKNGEIILYANKNLITYNTYTVVETGGGDVTGLLLSHKTKVLYKSDCREEMSKGNVMMWKRLRKKQFVGLTSNCEL